MEITASDDEVRRFSVGDVLLVEDTWGKGHASKVISDEDSQALLVTASNRHKIAFHEVLTISTS